MSRQDKETIDATIKGLEFIIAELKAGKIRPINFNVATPVRERVPRMPFHDNVEYEHTGDVYLEINFTRIK